MKLGICCNPDQARLVQEIGYDYVELNVAMTLSGDSDDFERLYKQFQDLEITVDAFNCFIPGNLKLTGPQLDFAAIETYINLVLPRAKALGAELIVFGSGPARSYPEGFPPDQAWEQIKEFLVMVARQATLNDLHICVEPLRRKEGNIINTLREAHALLKELNQPSLGLTLDIWHMMEEEEPFEVISEIGDLLYHVHVADSGRRYPGSGSYDFASFFAELKSIGYDRRISCEFSGTDFQEDAAKAYAFLKQMIKRI